MAADNGRRRSQVNCEGRACGLTSREDVRDALLGVEPHDYDVATDARPEQVQAIFPKSMAVGAHFGVVVVRTGAEHVEVATFRTDGSYKDGRRPGEVTFSAPEEDAQRRDFTVNGLFYDPATEEVIDFVGGRADLAAKRLRAIGDPAARFREDHLRLMRAVRFATTLGREIEPVTWAAVKTEAATLAKISIERIRDEFMKIMLHPNRVRGLDLLNESGLLTGWVEGWDMKLSTRLRAGGGRLLVLPQIQAEHLCPEVLDRL